MNEIKEKDVLKAVGDYLTAKRVFWWRNNTGAMAGSYKGKQRFFRFGLKGSSDIFALHRGVFCAIEIKAPGNMPSFDQVAFMERVRHHCGLAIWTDNVDFFIQWWENTVWPTNTTKTI